MTTEAEKLGKTGERMVPDLHKGILIYAEHLVRYIAGQGLVKDKVVLDIASGSGYGTKLLAETAKKAYGVDIDEDSIEYAKKKYMAPNIEYLVGDGEKIPLPDNSVDVVITYETIEHIKDYAQFMSEVSRVLKPDGLAVISTPNDLEFAEGNHYHLHEFTENELLNLVKKDFKYVDCYYQATWKYVAIGSEADLNKENLTAMTLLNYSPVKPSEYLYFFLLCSNRKITEIIKPMGALGEHYSDRYYIGVEMQHEKNIADYNTVLQAEKDTTAQLEKTVEDQTKTIQRQEQEIVRLGNSLHMITSTKSFRMANKVHIAKEKLVGRKKKD